MNLEAFAAGIAGGGLAGAFIGWAIWMWRRSSPPGSLLPAGSKQRRRCGAVVAYHSWTPPRCESK